ncbi:unnamed protein product [Fraxinus pennsylvanica]|uniref:SUZ domain-containing protein n=1 Tax=Fraxinus pennsylvanica TaxID=56036 RepID=A0AAD2ECE6_9LAMI|nr:unnamed protein product [Fraxinus pennsylvanica]
MELDIQKFLQNSGLHHFEFPHFPTSYLRLAAHRVAQHYGLQTMVQDNAVDGQGTRILVLKKPESKFPAVRLSDVPARQSETDELDQIKIVLKPRPSNASSNEVNGLGHKRSPVRTVDERKEEYDRARARIFSSPSSSESEDASGWVTSDRKSLNMGENEVSMNLVVDGEKSLGSREIGASSRVAIFRDREKDRTDPDYDRSYRRSPIMSPYHAMGLNQTSRDALYMQWPTQSMMYAHSCDHMRQTFFQAPFYQQPLSFDYSQNHP